MIDAFKVKCRRPGRGGARSLSGGNLQKFIVGREILQQPRVMIAAQPTWGVDVGAAAQIRQALIDLRDAGVAVLVVSEELDELFEICDRVAVIAQGRLSPAKRAAETDVEEIGMLDERHVLARRRSNGWSPIRCLGSKRAADLADGDALVAADRGRLTLLGGFVLFLRRWARIRSRGFHGLFHQAGVGRSTASANCCSRRRR